MVRNEDGTINGRESYIHFIDQTHHWEEKQRENGDIYNIKANIDGKYTFAELYENNYIPFTFAEFVGLDPVEDGECIFSYTGSEITILKLKQVIVTSNYGMSDLYAIIRDGKNNVVYTAVQRMNSASIMQTVFGETIDSTKMAEYADGNYTVEVVAQLSNGERPVLYCGKLNG